ncbi:MAG: outer membrane beta-barrel protein [Candidatus Hodarchaeota archaeon]
MTRRYRLKLTYIGIFILLSATLAFSAEVKVGRQLSETYSGNSFGFEIESKDSTIGRLEVVVYLSNAPADPNFSIEIETFDRSGTSAGTSGQVPLTIDSPSFTNVGGDNVRVIRTGGATDHDRFSISILLFSYFSIGQCGIYPPNADFHKSIRITMDNLSPGHLQAYIHSDGGALTSGGCDFEPSLTDKVSFIKDLPPGAEPKPIDVILVLDVSGSMADPASYTDPGAPDKIEILHESSQLFLNTWASDELFKPDDRVGAVFFESTASPYLGAGSFLVPFTSSPADDAAWTNINNEVHTHPTGNMTAMGDGLQEALDRFDNNSDNIRHIILFTNGMQNKGNLVEDSGTPGPHNKILNDKSLRSYGVPIHTIGTGVAEGSTYGTLLKDIAIDTGTGEHIFTTDIASDLTPAYFESLVNIFRGYSPELVGINSGIIDKGQEQVTHKYQVNRAAKSGIFVVSWHAFDESDKRQDAITMNIVGPGTVGAVTQGVKREGTHFHIHSVTFPLTGFPANAHEGEWQIIITEDLQGTSAYYHAALIVDEAKLDYLIGAVPRDYGTGENILLSASLSVDGQPITDADSIQCNVTRPRIPLGSFLHQHNLSDSDLNTNPPGVHEDNFPNNYSRKLYRLIVEKKLSDLLQPIRDPVPVQLFDDGDKEEHGDAVAGDGVYSAIYKKTEFPGQYVFDFSINGEHPIIGRYARAEKSTALVRVKIPDPEKSEVMCDDLGGGSHLVIIIPADRFGNFVGPGFEDEIEVAVSGGGTVAPPVTDVRVNGTYTVSLVDVPPEADPIVTVKVLGNVVEEVKLSTCINRPKKRYAVFGSLGANIPHGEFDDDYNTGVSAQIGFEYRFTNRFSAEGSFGFDQFDGSPDLDIYRLSANAKFYPLIGTFQVGIFGGPGVYILDPGDTHFGLNIGVGAEYRITTNWSLETTYNFHNAFRSGDDARFSTVHGGLRYRW